MSSHSSSRWLVGLLVLSILLGIVGGGVTGGVVGMYIAANHPTIVLPSANAELASAKTPSQPIITSKLSVTEDSAIIDTVNKSEPAVVTIINTMQASTTQRSRGQQNPFGPNQNPFGPNQNPFGPNQNPNGPTGGAAIAEGSGVIIDNQGHIITNNHVVDGASKLEVVFNDGSKVTAQLVGTDPVSDIALLKVDGNVPASLTLGDSNALQLGETAIAIGSPLGSYRGSVTVGVVSGLNRSVAGSGQENLIQTDAAINHGNSGGPLLNLAGQVVGINTLVVQDTTNGDPAQGLGFAVPSNTVSSVVNQLLAQGKVEYPYIGITYGEITPATAGEFNLSVQQGALVQDVSQNSPASSAGLQSNDIITALENTKIDENHTLRSILFQYKPGDTVNLSVLRNGKSMSVPVTLTSRPAETNVQQPG